MATAPNDVDDEEEMPTAQYLRDLAERIFRIPVMYGVDQGDYDRLRQIANAWDGIERHLANQNSKD